MPRLRFGLVTRQRQVIVGAAAVLAMGCVGDRGPAGDITRHHLVEELRVGDESAPAYQFTAISQIAVRDGAVYVRQQGQQEIRAFGFDGRHIRNIGRSGAGPGEFTGLESMGVFADTLWAIDGDLQRITLFRADGSVIETIPFTTSASLHADGRRYFPYPKVLTRDGAVLGFGGWFGNDVASGVTTSEPLLRMSRSGETRDTLGWVPLGNDHLILRTDRRAMYRTQPFTDAPIKEYGATAGRIYIVEQADPADPAAATVRVTSVRATGDTAWSAAVPYLPAPLSRSRVDSVRTSLLNGLGAIFPREVIERALYVPAYRAPITAALASEDGALWLRWDDQTRPGTYSVIGPDGRLTAEVSVEPGIRLRWASGDTAWGERVDDNDVPALVRYRIVKS